MASKVWVYFAFENIPQSSREIKSKNIPQGPQDYIEPEGKRTVLAFKCLPNICKYS